MDIYRPSIFHSPFSVESKNNGRHTDRHQFSLVQLWERGLTTGCGSARFNNSSANLGNGRPCCKEKYEAQLSPSDPRDALYQLKCCPTGVQNNAHRPRFIIV